MSGAVAEIHLVRHGRSAIVHDGEWMSADRVGDYEDAYDAVGIAEDSHPPARLLELASGAEVIAASDLLRAVRSAERLAPGTPPVIRPELRELRLEPPLWLPARLPIAAWDVMSAAQWTYRLTLRVEHEFVRRADAAARWLMAETAPGRTVLAVTHGGIRRLIDQRLRDYGCQLVAGRRSFENWSCWSYRRPIERGTPTGPTP